MNQAQNCSGLFQNDSLISKWRKIKAKINFITLFFIVTKNTNT